MGAKVPILSQKSATRVGQPWLSGVARGVWVGHPVRLRLVHMLWDLLEIVAGLVEVFGELMIESVAKLARGPKA